MSQARLPTLTVFGATGGCSANALVVALHAGLSCVAMVRTPSKLRTMLQEQYSVSADKIDAHLTVVQGNIRSVEDIKRTLTVTGRLPDRILFGIGGSPRMQFSLTAPITLDDPHVCEEGMKSVLAALRACVADGVPLGLMGSRPGLIVISTISMSSRRDMPYSYYPLEYWLVNIPRADKLATQKVVFAAAAEADPPFGGLAMVRMPLLTDGPAKGLDNVRAGWVWPDEQRKDKLAKGEKEAGPQIGYSITRADVGKWIFENLVRGGEDAFGKCWSLTN